ncbi:MAG: TIGR00282 family metallophosphoesterase [Pseudomonadota bacterium]
MRLLFLGDVVGRAGRQAVVEWLPRLRDRLEADFVIVNAENAAHGFGLTVKIAEAFYEAGADCLTSGNHIWSQREILTAIDGDRRLLRPANFPEGTPGRGASLLTGRNGHSVLVANVMARVFMDPLDDPFACVDNLLADISMPREADAIVVDFHGEATSEKMAMGHYLDGRVSLVVGTHTHIPTADMQILPGGTAYQTDAGMCGDFDSVIGMKKESVMSRFTTKIPGERMTPAEGQATICGLFVTTDDKTGLATQVEPLRLGGRLQRASPIADLDAASADTPT